MSGWFEDLLQWISFEGILLSIPAVCLYIVLWAATTYLLMFISNGIFIDLMKVDEENERYMMTVILSTPLLSLPLPYFEIGWIWGTWHMGWALGGIAGSIGVVGLWFALDN